MTRSGWLVLMVATTALLALLALFGLAIWDGFTPDQRAAALVALDGAKGVPIIAVAALLALFAFIVRLIFSRWVKPLPAIAENARLIALGNPRHRLPLSGAAEVRMIAESVNLLADRYQALGEDVEARIREANALLEEEKDTLAALMSKLTQGVLVCNPDGRILLYNARAQRLLEGPARASGGGDWIGLGRSVFGVLEEAVIRHALATIRHRLENGESALLVPFVASRPGGQLLSSHLVPILDHDRALRGYILTFEDVTRRFDAESRRGTLLQSLTEGLRSGVGGIRAAIETVLSYPEMDEGGRQQFFEVIRDEACKVSQHLDRLEAEYRDELKPNMPFEETLGADLLAAVERALKETRGRDIELSAPLEPVWLDVQSYAIIQSLLFLIDQVTEFCRAENLTLALDSKRALCAFELQWDGAAVHMEALRRWGLRNVYGNGRAEPVSLFEAIEQHGGAIWPDRAGGSGRPCLRVVLPVSARSAGSAQSDDGYGNDFDFHLFEHRSSGPADLAPLPLDRLSVTVLDTETTGLDPDQGDEIIAIGAIRVVNGRILRQESFDSFVRPTRRISEASNAIHGITADMLRAQPPIEEVLPRLRRFVEDTVIVGHNVDFDMRFFAAAGPSTGVLFENVVLDTLLLECALNASLEDRSLEGIAGRLGIAVTGRHTALGDALTTAEIFIAMIPLLAARGVRTLGEARQLCLNSPYARLTR